MMGGSVRLGVFKINAIDWKYFRLNFTGEIPQHEVILK
jgi:hypothetical protein